MFINVKSLKRLNETLTTIVMKNQFFDYQIERLKTLINFTVCMWTHDLHV